MRVSVKLKLGIAFAVVNGKAESAVKAAHLPVPPARRGASKPNGAGKGVKLHLDDRFAAPDGEDASFQRY